MFLITIFVLFSCSFVRLSVVSSLWWKVLQYMHIAILVCVWGNNNRETYNQQLHTFVFFLSFVLFFYLSSSSSTSKKTRIIFFRFRFFFIPICIRTRWAWTMDLHAHAREAAKHLSLPLCPKWDTSEVEWNEEREKENARAASEEEIIAGALFFYRILFLFSSFVFLVETPTTRSGHSSFSATHIPSTLLLSCLLRRLNNSVARMNRME